jgi:uncharacterized membrane protein YfcA
MIIYFIMYMLCGALMGFFAGLLGIGGGIIGIPLLLLLFNMQGMSQSVAMHMAIGTLFTTVMVTSISTIYSHYKKSMILFPIFKKILIGTLVGCVLGILISNHLSATILQRIFGIFLLILAFYMLLNIEIKSDREFPGKINVFIITLMIGTVSGMLGLGGGVLIVPYLMWCGISIRYAIATASACIFPVAMVGTIGYMLSGVAMSGAPELSTGYIYWPAFVGISLVSVLFAPLGVKVAHLISASLLRKSFCVFLVCMGLNMLIRVG